MTPERNARTLDWRGLLAIHDYYHLHWLTQKDALQNLLCHQTLPTLIMQQTTQQLLRAVGFPLCAAYLLPSDILDGL
ncbi:hypothetical protein L1987_77756 [Smallanthus sonchifolius]|uniref:Uncharacterized protein n=1 Tax=Smallanthus sonchifolius TaxID=185202 RepID=A0ACB8ZAL9_9ASTR|nr:hypothetical protein L1987_77756 [Smallanthus sonchifolius]